MQYPLQSPNAQSVAKIPRENPVAITFIIANMNPPLNDSTAKASFKIIKKQFGTVIMF